MNDFMERCIRRARERASQDPTSQRTHLSRLHEERMIATRQHWGELRPGQRSINEPWVD